MLDENNDLKSERKLIWENMRKGDNYLWNHLGVNLSLARKILANRDEFYNTWFLINCCLPIFLIILNFFILGLGYGLILNIIYIIIYFSICGIASISPKKSFNFIWGLALVSVIISILLPQFNLLLLVFILLHLISITYFYHKIFNKIVNDSLISFEYFNYLIDVGIIQYVI